MSKGTASLGQFAEISSAITKALPKSIEDLDPKEVISIVISGKHLGEALNTMFRSLMNNNCMVVFDNDAKKTSEIIAEIRKHFKVWSYWSDEELDKQFPPPPKPTERKFRNTQEPDKEKLGKPVRGVDGDGAKGITLRERLLMGFGYWKRTGKHLDIKGPTLCCGSLGRDGSLPVVHWSSAHEQMDIYWFGVGDSSLHGGVRLAVS